MFATPENIFEMIEHSWAMTNLGLSVTLDMTRFTNATKTTKTSEAILWLGVGADRSYYVDQMIKNGQPIYALCSYQPREGFPLNHFRRSSRYTEDKDNALLRDCTSKVESKDWAFQYVLLVTLENGSDDILLARRIEPLLLGERISALLLEERTSADRKIEGIPFWSQMYPTFRVRSRVIIRRQRSNQEAGRIVMAELKQLEDVLRRATRDDCPPVAYRY